MWVYYSLDSFIMREQGNRGCIRGQRPRTRGPGAGALCSFHCYRLVLFPNDWLITYPLVSLIRTAGSLEASLLKGKAVVRIMKRAPAWRARRDDFRRFSGASIELQGQLEQISTTFREELNQLSPSIQEATLSDRVKCMKTAEKPCRLLPQIRDSLRKGATVRTEQEIMDALSHFWEFLDRRSPAEAELLTMMDTVAGYLDTSTNEKGTQLKKAFSNQLLVWDRSMQIGGLKHFSQQPMQNAQDMKVF